MPPPSLMCRWNAYFGQPVQLDELLFRTQHSLIDQSCTRVWRVETTNGDGFGVGWYRPGKSETPARYRSVTPARSDANLRDLTSHIESPLFLAHIRATTGTPVQQTNCRPFRHGPDEQQGVPPGPCYVPARARPGRRQPW